MNALFELVDISHYYGSVCALRDISLCVEPGAVGLVGQNGAGKSTMMQILLGLIQPTHGTARVLGRDVCSRGLELRGQLGYMPERDAVVQGLKGVELVALAGELSGMPRKQALRRAHETLSFLGLEEARYRKIEQYSVGMRQRLKLAATLVHDPDVLLLDEPTAGLDPDGRSAMLSLLASLAARPGKSLVLSTHLLGDIERVCDRAVILDRGRLVCVGSHSELRFGSPRSYRLRWEGNPDAFLTTLRKEGVDIQHQTRTDEVQAILPDAFSTQDVFTQAERHGIVLTGLEPVEEDLDAVYRRMISQRNTQDTPETVVPSEGLATTQGE